MSTPSNAPTSHGIIEVKLTKDEVFEAGRLSAVAGYTTLEEFAMAAVKETIRTGRTPAPADTEKAAS